MNKILDVNMRKKSSILDYCLGVFTVLLLGIFFILSFQLYINPTVSSTYLHPYGYGLYARDYAVVIGLLIFILVSTYIIIRKHLTNNIIPDKLIIPILLCSLLGFIVISIKESRSIASYTTDINHYQVYDEVLEKRIELIADLLPKKETVIKYEYLMHESSSIWGSNTRYAITIQTKFDNNLYQELSEKDNLEIKNLTDPWLNNYECFEYVISDSGTNKKELILNFYILFNKTDNKIIYVATNRSYDVFDRYNNIFYIGAFINGDRTSPYFTYEKTIS